MVEMKQITPFIMCNNLKEQIAFFETCLGFKLGFLGEEDRHAFLRRNNVAVRILEVGFDLADVAREQMVYIDVDDVDALWVELKPGLDQLPEGRARGPFNQPYGQREFHVKDEGACLLMFGMAIPVAEN